MLTFRSIFTSYNSRSQRNIDIAKKIDLNLERCSTQQWRLHIQVVLGACDSTANCGKINVLRDLGLCWQISCAKTCVNEVYNHCNLVM